MKYFQCELSHGNSKQVAWIEERGAKAGKIVEILDPKLDMNRLWHVDRVYAYSLTQDQFKEMKKKSHESWSKLANV